MPNATAANNTDGQSSVDFDFTKKGGSDCIPDKIMAEIVRRIQGFIISGELGDVIFSADPPNNPKKIWIEIDANGSIIGTVKRFDTESGEWVDDHTELPDPFDLKDFAGTKTLGSDDETVNFNHNFDSDSYGYAVFWTSDPSEDGRWFEVDKGINTLEIKVLGASGASLRIEIIEIFQP